MRVLFLTHRLPYAPNRGDRIRSFHTARILAARTNLTVVSLVHDRDEATHANALRAMGIDVHTFLVPKVRTLAKGLLRLGGDTPLTHALLDAPGVCGALQRIVHEQPPDVVLAYCSGMARFAMEPPLARLPLVLDLVDVDSEKWRTLSMTTRGPKGWLYARESRTLERFEHRAAFHAHSTLVVNEREHDVLQRVATNASTRVVCNGIDLESFRPSSEPADTSNVVFCGVMGYAPNVDAVLWFAKEVWPEIVRNKPDARLIVVGSDPAPAIRQLGARDERVQITGKVPDVRPFLWNAAVSIAPLRVARGVQNKVLEAIAAGLPAVVTSPVFEGLPGDAHPACSVADQPEAFARQVIGLLRLGRSERRALAQKATLEGLTWESRLSPLVETLEAAALGRTN